MHDPYGVADGSEGFASPMAVRSRLARLAERRRPTKVRPCHAFISHRFQPWIKPSQAKSASSQGGALATTESVHKQQLNHTEDMNMESLHD
jgi:hypothetical protein